MSLIGPLSDQQVMTVYAVATFLTVAPLLIACAAIAGHLRRLVSEAKG